MTVEIANEARAWLPRSVFLRVARRAGSIFSLPRRSHVHLALVTDRRMRSIHRAALGLDRPTDVLAFPLYRNGSWRSAPADPDGFLRLGDVVIARETAKRQAQERGGSLKQELGELFAHGLLHLLGYDHRSAREAAVMNRAARRL